MKAGFNLNRFLNDKGLTATNGTDREDLLELLQGLKPLAIHQELVRLGSHGDGGYLIPDDLDNITACFSPGVSDNADFEQDLSERGIRSFLADPSVDGPPQPNPLFDFEKKRVSSRHHPDHLRLERWIAEKTPEARDNLLLQMDIEGAEYEVILDTHPSVLRKFRCLVIEFHNLDLLRSAPVFTFYRQVFSKLLSIFATVHLHPNNRADLVDYQDIVIPKVIEMTFFRRDLLDKKMAAVTLPHPLDVDNSQSKPTVTLPECWWRRQVGINDFLSYVEGVIHVGANSGQERNHYNHHDLKVAWFEAIPSVFQDLEKNLENLPRQKGFQYLLADEDGITFDFNISNNEGQSSSIYDLAMHKDVWPNIHYTHKEKLVSSRLDSVFAAENLSIDDYQAMVLDTQGSELLVLKGAGDLLHNLKYLRIEAADYEGYTDNCTVADLEAFLFPLGFKEITRLGFGEHPSGGSYYDIIYARD
ncbi:FkbM family methyltransferase [Rhodovibrionaceae bacterium A322]